MLGAVQSNGCNVLETRSKHRSYVREAAQNKHFFPKFFLNYTAYESQVPTTTDGNYVLMDYLSYEYEIRLQTFRRLILDTDCL